MGNAENCDTLTLLAYKSSTVFKIKKEGYIFALAPYIRADIDYTLPYTMALTQNVWYKIDWKAGISSGISLAADSINCPYKGVVDLHFESNLQNIASKEYEWRIRKVSNGVASIIKTIKITGGSENVNRTINYRDKIDYANTTYAIEFRCITAAPGSIIMYSGFVNVDYVYIDVNN